MEFFFAHPLFKKKIADIDALASVAQWSECWPVNQKVAGSIPSQGTCLGCRLGPQLGLCERQPIDLSHVDVSLSSLPLFTYIENLISY